MARLAPKKQTKFLTIFSQLFSSFYREIEYRSGCFIMQCVLKCLHFIYYRYYIVKKDYHVDGEKKETKSLTLTDTV